MDYSTLWIFDCPVDSSIDSQKRNKTEFKFKKCIFIGFTKKVKSFRIWDLETRSVFTSRDMIFDEELMLQEKSKTEDKRKVEFQTVWQTHKKRELSSQIALKDLKSQMRTSQIQMEMNMRLLKEQPRPLKQSVRVMVPPARSAWEDDHVSFALVTKTGDPSSYRKAIEADDHSK